MKKKQKQNAVIYAGRNHLVSVALREDTEEGSGILQVRVSPEAYSKVRVLKNGSISIEFHDGTDLGAFVDAMRRTLDQRDLDEKRWFPKERRRT